MQQLLPQGFGYCWLQLLAWLLCIPIPAASLYKFPMLDAINELRQLPTGERATKKICRCINNNLCTDSVLSPFKLIITLTAAFPSRQGLSVARRALSNRAPPVVQLFFWEALRLLHRTTGRGCVFMRTMSTMDQAELRR